MSDNTIETLPRVPMRDTISPEVYTELEDKYSYDFDRSLSYISIMDDFFDEDAQEIIAQTDIGIIGVYIYLRTKMAFSQNGYYIDVTGGKQLILFKNIKHFFNLEDDQLRKYMQVLVNYSWIQRLTVEDGEKVIFTCKEGVQNFETINSKRKRSRKSTQESREREAKRKLDREMRKKNKQSQEDEAI